MTAVARLAPGSYPLLVGDLLLSGRGTITPGPVPTVDDVNEVFPPGTADVPYGLVQKIAIVGDNLMMGWAGASRIAEEVICDIREQCHVKPFTCTSLMQYLDALTPSVWESLCVAGFIREPQGVYEFQRLCHTFQTPRFGEVALCGSGIEALERFLTDFPPLPEPTRAINLNEHCTSIGLMLTGTFLQVEWATHETLKHLYGGGYEIATLYGDGFRKVDDITYLFWTAELTENPTGVKVVPRRAFRYAYCGDLLRIRSVTLIPTRQGFSGSDTLFAVPPIYRDLTADEDRDVTRPAFDTTWLCNYFLVHSGATIKVITCAIDYRYTDRKRLVNFTEIPNGIALNVHGQFLHREGERILTVLGLHKPS